MLVGRVEDAAGAVDAHAERIATRRISKWRATRTVRDYRRLE